MGKLAVVATTIFAFFSVGTRLHGIWDLMTALVTCLRRSVVEAAPSPVGWIKSQCAGVG
jgi:hypothetical protein